MNLNTYLKLTCYLGSLLLGQVALSQSTINWDGGGDGTSWDDALNWNGDAEPAAGDIARFGNGGTLTITGTPTNNPGRINIDASTNVTFDLDITIVDTYTQHSIQVNAGCSLTLGSAGNNRTFTISTDLTRSAIGIFSGATSAMITVASSTTVNINQADRGIWMQESTATFTNNGTIVISGADNAGIQLDNGDLDNNSSITVSSSLTKSILMNDGTFDNASTGTLTLSNSTSQGVDVMGGTFTQSGTLNVNSSATDGIQVETGAFNTASGSTTTISNATYAVDMNSGTFSNDGTLSITSTGLIGIRLVDGTFNNTSNGSITMPNVDSGGSGAGILLTSGGTSGKTFTNVGSISVTSSTAEFGVEYLLGTFTNQSSGTITVDGVSSDGVRVTSTSFTNAGIINATSSATATNSEYAVDIQSGGTLTNTGTINADGGSGSDGRAVQIIGTLNNSGTINVANGNLANDFRIASGGVFTNNSGGLIDLTLARIANNAGGSLTNNGLIKSTYSGSVGISGSGTTVNSAFYSYSDGSANTFSTGTATDNGIDLDDSSNTTFDAMNSDNIADIGIDVAYNWYSDTGNTTQVGSNTASGAFDFIDDPSVTGITAVYTSYGTDVTLTFSNVLPVELLFFEAIVTETSNRLIWATGSETNNAGFEIQKSMDGVSWVVIGFVEGTGTSSSQQSYEWIDKNPTMGLSYYRLRQIDFDGREELHEAIISIREEIQEVFRVYPNPVQSVLVVDHSRSIPSATFYLHDINGKEIQLTWIDDNCIDLSRLEPGIYFGSIAHGSQKPFRIVKE